MHFTCAKCPQVSSAILAPMHVGVVHMMAKLVLLWKEGSVLVSYSYRTVCCLRITLCILRPLTSGGVAQL